MKLEDSVFVDVRCFAPYNGRQVRRTGMHSYVLLTDVLDLGRKMGYMAPYVNDSCLRDGLVLNAGMKIKCTRGSNFSLGRVDITGVGRVTQCKCDKKFNVSGVGVKERAQVCFKNLACGKCVDPYVRGTVGALFFPQHYSNNQKVATKELLTNVKMCELFGANYKLVRWYNYDTETYDDGSRPISEKDKKSYACLKSMLEKDARLKGFELVAVLSRNISYGAYIQCGKEGALIKNLDQCLFDSRKWGTNAHAGTVVLRNKRSGKILPVPNTWIVTGMSVNATDDGYETESSSFGLPGVAWLIDFESWMNGCNSYQKLINLYLEQMHQQRTR